MKARSVALLGVLALAACSTTPDQPDVPTPSPSASAAPTATSEPSPSATVHDPFPDRPASTVEPWPDYGDFAIDATKAALPGFTLAQEERWDEYDYLQRIAGTAQARWVGSWESDQRVSDLARDVYQEAAATERIGLVAYQGMRDYPCERAVDDPSLRDAYVARTEALVSTLPETGAQAWIVVEPGLLADLGSCDGDPRGAWLEEGVGIIADAGGVPYLAAGPLRPGDPDLYAAAAAGLDLSRVAGFAVNIGGFLSAGDQVGQGHAMLEAIAAAGVDTTSPRDGADPGDPGLGLIVDTSRNGVPILDPEACNPPQAGIGVPPQLLGDGHVDAHVWIKRPGESDGSCNGGPALGQFSLGIALDLATHGSLVAQ